MRNLVSGFMIVLGALGLAVVLYSPSHGETGLSGGQLLGEVRMVTDH